MKENHRAGNLENRRSTNCERVLRIILSYFTAKISVKTETEYFSTKWESINCLELEYFMRFNLSRVC